MRFFTITAGRRLDRLAAPVTTFAILAAVLGFTFAVNDPAVSAESAAAFSAVPGEIGFVLPVDVQGAVLGVSDGRLAIIETAGDGPVAFPVALGLSVTRGGVEVPVDALRPGDRIAMTVDGRTGSVLRADARPAAAPPFAPSGEAALLAALGLAGGGVALAIRRRSAPLRLGSGRPAFAQAAARI
ncbi:MAG: hypothetical protein ACKOWF_01380 [Chloroflexota bacterium]